MKQKLKNSRGLAQIPIILGLLLMAVAIPAASQLVKQNQTNQGRAASSCCDSGKYCTGYCMGSTCQGSCVSQGSTVAPVCTPNCNDAGSHCAGSTYTGNCGNQCQGSKNCSPTSAPQPTCNSSCGSASEHSCGSHWTNGCGGDCGPGTKQCGATTAPTSKPAATATTKPAATSTPASSTGSSCCANGYYCTTYCINNTTCGSNSCVRDINNPTPTINCGSCGKLADFCSGQPVYNACGAICGYGTGNCASPNPSMPLNPTQIPCNSSCGNASDHCSGTYWKNGCAQQCGPGTRTCQPTAAASPTASPTRAPTNTPVATITPTKVVGTPTPIYSYGMCADNILNTTIGQSCTLNPNCQNNTHKVSCQPDKLSQSARCYCTEHRNVSNWLTPTYTECEWQFYTVSNKTDMGTEPTSCSRFGGPAKPQNCYTQGECDNGVPSCGWCCGGSYFNSQDGKKYCGTPSSNLLTPSPIISLTPTISNLCPASSCFDWTQNCETMAMHLSSKVCASSTKICCQVGIGFPTVTPTLPPVSGYACYCSAANGILAACNTNDCHWSKTQPSNSYVQNGGSACCGNAPLASPTPTPVTATRCCCDDYGNCSKKAVCNSSTNTEGSYLHEMDGSFCTSVAVPTVTSAPGCSNSGACGGLNESCSKCCNGLYYYSLGNYYCGSLSITGTTPSLTPTSIKGTVTPTSASNKITAVPTSVKTSGSCDVECRAKGYTGTVYDQCMSQCIPTPTPKSPGSCDVECRSRGLIGSVYDQCMLQCIPTPTNAQRSTCLNTCDTNHTTGQAYYACIANCAATPIPTQSSDACYAKCDSNGSTGQAYYSCLQNCIQATPTSIKSIPTTAATVPTSKPAPTSAPPAAPTSSNTNPATGSCSYVSLQARVQTDVAHPWVEQLTINSGSSVDLLCAYNGVGLAANNVQIVAAYSTGAVTTFNGGTATAWKPTNTGNYTIYCKSTDSKCGGLTSDSAVLKVGGGVCKECPNDFSCYGNSTGYKWFASGYVADGYTQVPENYCTSTGVIKPTWKGKVKGDANCDGSITVADYSVWQSEYSSIGGYAVNSADWEADFTGNAGVCDGVVNGADFSLWRRSFIDLGGN